MNNYGDIQTFAEAMLGATPSRSGGSEWAADCPACGKQKHFSFNVDKGVGHCFVCGYGVNLARLIADVSGMSIESARDAARELLGTSTRIMLKSLAESKDIERTLSALLKRRFTFAAESEETHELELLELPEGCLPIDARDSARGRRYLLQRGMTPALYTRYRLQFVPREAVRGTDCSRYGDHIIFPEYDACGALRYYTSRATYEPKRGRKSYNPRAPRRGVLYGLHCLRRAPFVIVTEGPLDVISLGGFAVGLFGKQMDDEHALTLAALRRRVIVALDADASVVDVRSCVDRLRKQRVHANQIGIYTQTHGKDFADWAHADDASAMQRVAAVARGGLSVLYRYVCNASQGVD